MTLSLAGLLLLVVVGAICGMVAEGLVGFSRGGFFVSAFLGFLGAWLGAWGAHRLGLPSLLALQIEGVKMKIIWAIVGAMILVAMLALVRRSGYRRRFI